MDFAAYEAWSTMLLPQQDTPPIFNETIALRLVLLEVGLDYTFEPLVIALEPMQHFAWRQTTGVRGIFDGEHHFVLYATDDGHTRLHNYERYSGLFAPVLQRLPMMQAAPAGFVAMNDEIKARAESLSVAQG